MKVQPIPKHFSATLHPNEMFDLIVTLRAAVREFGDTVPESISTMLTDLEGAYAALCGDLPEVPGEPLDEAAA